MIHDCNDEWDDSEESKIMLYFIFSVFIIVCITSL